jgi:pilus assembly protein Flp/PilA
MQERLLKLYVTMQSGWTSLVNDDRGQDLIEYALVASLVALAATAGMNSVATSLSNAFTRISTKISTYVS